LPTAFWSSTRARRSRRAIRTRWPATRWSSKRISGRLPMLEVRDLVASYGELLAVQGASLTVNAGEICTLVGPNGAGKTTLLRTIAGLHDAASGSVLLEGQPIHRLLAHQIVERGVILVPEGRKLFPHMTVGENLELGAFA